MEVHIEMIGNKVRIQPRPGNPYLFTASTTPLTVEIHNEHNLFIQLDRVEGFSAEKSHPQSLVDGFWPLLRSQGERRV